METMTMKILQQQTVMPKLHLSMPQTKRKFWSPQCVMKNAQKIMPFKKKNDRWLGLNSWLILSRIQKYCSDRLERYFVIQHSAQDLHQFDARARHFFELTDEILTTHRNRKIHQKLTEIHIVELKMVTDAGIVSPIIPTWPFVVVTASEKIVLEDNMLSTALQRET